MTSALLLIDIQNDYFPGGNMELAGMQAAAGNARSLLAHFRRDGRALFHVQHISVQPGATFFLPGSEGADTHALVSAEGDEPVIRKNYPNSFRETGLLDSLRAGGVEDLVICGAMSHMCVDATTRAACDFGFRCTVVQDACATRDLEFNGQAVGAAAVHAAFMAALGAAYAQVVDTREYAAS